ncbi:MAG: amidohydrolase [Verrucomicrobiales bacterium]|nr:amidohydrolase [Verrucomicrobiales bacterium]
MENQIKKVVTLLLLVCLLVSKGMAQSEKMILEKRDQDYAYLFDLYQHLHRNPELSFHEEKTSQRIAKELKQVGFEVTEKVGGYGLVGVLKNGEGPTILLRTDLDGLPVKEESGKPYASQVKTKDDADKEVSVMHACGHDTHMTTFIGAARLLASIKDQWQGTLVMIGQAAEERSAGARAMLDDGLFTRFPKPDFCVAQHVSATLEAGKVAYVKGFSMANVNSVDITVRGIGGHGAAPHTTKDPVVLAAQIVLALQTIVSREINPTDDAVVTVGSIHGGTKHNIIPNQVKLQLTLRSYKDEVRQHTIAAIKRICKGLGEAAGLPEELLPIVTVLKKSTPSTYNDPELVEQLRLDLEKVLGADNVVSTDPVMAGEDFSEYGRTADKIPICLFWLGGVDAEAVKASRKSGKPLPSLHSPFFAPDPEPTIKTGVANLVSAVLSLAGKGKGE